MAQAKTQVISMYSKSQLLYQGGQPTDNAHIQ